MKIVRAIDYPASPHVVFLMLSDEAFHERKCQAAGALEHFVTITTTGAGASIITARVMSTDGLPDFVRSMVGARITILETYHWGPADASGNRIGSLVVNVGDAPLAMTANVDLAPADAGTVMTIDGHLRARIPLFGSKVEVAAAPVIDAAIRVEHRTGQAWLAG
ncbi:MAG TPA: DUF2505 domain-containing protein [Candidatus Lustribacter sp.]|nr:DUF2505 domain-containing protein [Candidatus Lustribacter sp.]